MKKLAMLVMAGLVTLGAAGAAFAECPGGGHKKTASTTTDQDVKKGS